MMAVFQGYRSVMPQFLMFSPSLKMSLSLVVFSLLALAPLARATNWACKSQSDAGMDEILYRSPIVVLGKVVEHHTNKPQVPGVYAAELDVYCIYKGGPLPVKINITHAGVVPGVCFSTNYSIDSEVLAYLQSHEDGTLTPTYKEHPSSYKDEIFVNCGISIEYPGRLTQDTAHYDCDQDADYIYDDTKCIEYKPKPDVVGDIEVNPPPSDGRTYTEEKDVQRPDMKPDGGKTGAVEDDENESASLRMSLSLFLFLSTVVLLLS